MNIQEWITLIVIIGIVAYAVYLTITKKWTELREFAYALMLSAERLYEANQGKEKFNAVFNVVYGCIPGWLQSILTEEKIKKQLQEWYDLAKDYLDDGYINRIPG